MPGSRAIEANNNNNNNNNNVVESAHHRRRESIGRIRQRLLEARSQCEALKTKLEETADHITQQAEDNEAAAVAAVAAAAEAVDQREDDNYSGASHQSLGYTPPEEKEDSVSCFLEIDDIVDVFIDGIPQAPQQEHHHHIPEPVAVEEEKHSQRRRSCVLLLPIRNPVVTPDGFSYDQAVVKELGWDEAEKIAYPNRALKAILKESNGNPFDKATERLAGLLLKKESPEEEEEEEVGQESLITDKRIENLLLTTSDTMPKPYYCPITSKLMRDPVIDPEGYTYERTAILNWLQFEKKSPITKKPVNIEDLYPNSALSLSTIIANLKVPLKQCLQKNSFKNSKPSECSTTSRTASMSEESHGSSDFFEWPATAVCTDDITTTEEATTSVSDSQDPDSSSGIYSDISPLTSTPEMEWDCPIPPKMKDHELSKKNESFSFVFEAPWSFTDYPDEFHRPEIGSTTSSGISSDIAAWLNSNRAKNKKSCMVAPRQPRRRMKKTVSTRLRGVARELKLVGCIVNRHSSGPVSV